MPAKPDPITIDRRPKRCAIYTRKSTDEGLDSGFSSLDAQRAACSAFIASQRHENWVELIERYDDGGYSGGNLDRPAFQRLLGDIRAKKVDVVAVYKVDRLTRSLLDFAKIVEVMDEHGASFVSITQSFNSTNSMGRLTLNVLLSFAQFEREIASERVRDKIAASKAKGLWVGGTVPFGYDNVDRKLVVNERDADAVRRIFELYRSGVTGRELVRKLAADGFVGRSRMRGGIPCEGRPIGLGALYAMLRNRTYVGEVEYRGAVYPGVHSPIVDQAVFDEVGARLQNARVAKKLQVQARVPSLFAGLIRDKYGRLMSPSHTQRGSRRYRYYFSQDKPGSSERENCRINAQEIENVVLRQVDAAMDSGLAAIASTEQTSTDLIRNAQARVAEIRLSLTNLTLPASREMLRRLVTSVSIDHETLRVVVELGELPNSQAHFPVFEGSVPIRGVRRSRTLRIVLPSLESSRPATSALVQLVSQAFAVRRLLEAGAEIASVAQRFGWHEDYIADLMRVALLAPSIIGSMVTGTQPDCFSRRSVMHASEVPLRWSRQREVFGF